MGQSTASENLMEVTHCFDAIPGHYDEISTNRDVSIRRRLRFVTKSTGQYVQPQSDSDELREDNNGTKPLYGFGVRFSYYRDFTEYAFVEAKYSNLKEEMLYNQVPGGSVDIGQWYNIYKKAKQRRNTKSVRKIRATDDVPMWNQLTGITPKSRMSMNHIVSMLFYTDFDELPRNLKKVCRRQSMDESDESIKKRHSEAVHWLKLLFECIMLFGKPFSKWPRTVYHGVDQKFLFKDFTARYALSKVLIKVPVDLRCCTFCRFAIPTSTSIDANVARRFADAEGVVLELQSCDSIEKTRYFDTSPLSRYSEEAECLFFWATLQISGIQMYDSDYKLIHFDMAPLLLFEGKDSLRQKSGATVMTPEVARRKLERYLSVLETEKKERKKNHSVTVVVRYGLDMLKCCYEKLPRYLSVMERENKELLDTVLDVKKNHSMTMKEYVANYEKEQWKELNTRDRELLNLLTDGERYGLDMLLFCHSCYPHYYHRRKQGALGRMKSVLDKAYHIIWDSVGCLKEVICSCAR